MAGQTTGLYLALLALTSAGPPTWTWRGPAPRSGVVEVDLVRGSITVERTGGAQVELFARRVGRRDDPATVQLVLREERGRLLLSAVYPTRRAPGRGALPVNPETGRMECLPEDPRGDFWYSDVRVDLVVRVPDGVRVQAGLLDGKVSGPADLLLRPPASPSGR